VQQLNSINKKYMCITNWVNFYERKIACLLTILLSFGFARCQSEIKHLSFRYFDNTEAEQLANAVKNENTAEIMSILETNPNLINFQDPIKGNTLLMLAVVYQLKESCVVLLKYGANPNICNSFNYSAMFYGFESTYAPDNCDLTIPKLLIKHHGNVNFIDSIHSQTLLMSSISGKIKPFNCNSRILLLIENGADINLYVNNPTRCSLNRAIVRENYEVAEILLFEYNAKIPEYGIKRLNRNNEEFYISFKELIKEKINESEFDKEKLESLNRIMKHIEDKGY
jgi:ankyrin repeat protein